MLIGLPDRECRFEKADHAAEDAGLNGGVFVAGDTPVIHRALHDQDLLQCGVVTAPLGAVCLPRLLSMGAV